MGITGLLPFLKKSTRPANVSEFSGKTAAIDVYCWLHKGAFGCAEKLVQNKPTDGYIVYVMKFVDMLLHFNVKPILVFDGRNLPSKSETEKKRRENRQKNRKLAQDYLREGKLKEARECFQRCVDITPAMAREVIEACRERNIDCIVAPYEADAQLAFLSKSGIADFIISEDSDLAPFGCDKILFKMDIAGNGNLYESDKLPLCLGQRADNFTLDKFRYMCIMAGCDYHPSLPGIGIVKSCKFWSKVTNLDIRTVLTKIPAYLNMHQLEVTEEYISGFIQANQTFLYQLVYDPRSRRLRPLNDYPDDEVDGHSYPFAGAYVEDDLAFQMAIGNVDIHTMDMVGYYDPDVDSQGDGVKPRYGSRASHASMWWPADRREGHRAAAEEIEKAKREKSNAVLRAFNIPLNAPAPIGSVTSKRKPLMALSHLDAGHGEDPDEDPDDPQPMDMTDSIDDVMNIYSAAKKIKLEKMTTEKKVPPNDASERIVYVSKYFHAKKQTQDKKSEEAVDKDAPTVTSKENQKKKSSNRQSGDWLTELDKSVEDESSNRFNPVNNCNTGSSKENFLPTKINHLPPLKNNPATRQAFKPVVTANSRSNEESSTPMTSPDKPNDVIRKRNPFALRRPMTSQEPLTQVTVDPGYDLIQSTLIEISSSQLSISSLNEDMCETSIKDPSPTRSPVEVITESVYFKKKTSPAPCTGKGSQSKPRTPVSGLMRKSKVLVDAKQPKLFELWGKKK